MCAIISFWVIFNSLACRCFLMITCTCKIFQKFIKYIFRVHFIACKGFSYCYPMKYGFFDSYLLCIEGATLEKKPAQAWLFIIGKWCLAAQKINQPHAANKDQRLFQSWRGESSVKKFLQTSMRIIILSYLYIVWKLFVSCIRAKTNIHGNTMNASGVNCVVNGEGQHKKREEKCNWGYLELFYFCCPVSDRSPTFALSCVCRDVYVNQVLAYSPWPLYEIQCKIAWTLWPNYQLRWKHLFFGMGHALIQPILVWTTAKFVTWLLISSGIRGIIPWRFIQLWNKRNAKRNEIEIPGCSGVQ